MPVAVADDHGVVGFGGLPRLPLRSRRYHSTVAGGTNHILPFNSAPGSAPLSQSRRNAAVLFNPTAFAISANVM